MRLFGTGTIVIQGQARGAVNYDIIINRSTAEISAGYLTGDSGTLFEAWEAEELITLTLQDGRTIDGVVSKVTPEGAIFRSGGDISDL